jgi:hypothetical protein
MFQTIVYNYTTAGNSISFNSILVAKANTLSCLSLKELVEVAHIASLRSDEFASVYVPLFVSKLT